MSDPHFLFSAGIACHPDEACIPPAPDAALLAAHDVTNALLAQGLVIEPTSIVPALERALAAERRRCARMADALCGTAIGDSIRGMA